VDNLIFTVHLPYPHARLFFLYQNVPSPAARVRHLGIVGSNFIEKMQWFESNEHRHGRIAEALNTRGEGTFNVPSKSFMDGEQPGTVGTQSLFF
jgi:hypothetical protein